jgi:hypothetical protein
LVRDGGTTFIGAQAKLLSAPSYLPPRSCIESAVPANTWQVVEFADELPQARLAGAQSQCTSHARPVLPRSLQVVDSTAEIVGNGGWHS